MTRPNASGLMHIAPGDDLPLHAARGAVTAAIRTAIDAGARRLLVDFHAWRGHEVPTLALRIDSVLEWAAAAESAPGFRVALVMPPHMVDPGRIGAIVGTRAGFDFDVFGQLDDALAWLDGVAPSLS